MSVEVIDCPACGELIWERGFSRWWHDRFICSGIKHKVRKVLRSALERLDLPTGIDDDECLVGEECGIRLGKWSLCWCMDENRNGALGVFLIHDEEGEFFVGSRLCDHDIAAGLGLVVDRKHLWEQLRSCGGKEV